MHQVIRLSERLPVEASGEVLRPMLTRCWGKSNVMLVPCRYVLFPYMFRGWTALHGHAAPCVLKARTITYMYITA
ncbi:hypothetical protein DPMN_028399 [Dreissena polymorpha]|uniref:Uncharacterized protein n=1 Tax=Dreissena polymorpha TaxID=45954 RepID=A0A9D4LW83_DREPO|nr:hypothetical protein DPMN_028399 [Dreissena polymorpha]